MSREDSSPLLGEEVKGGGGGVVLKPVSFIGKLNHDLWSLIIGCLLPSQNNGEPLDLQVLVNLFILANAKDKSLANVIRQGVRNFLEIAFSLDHQKRAAYESLHGLSALTGDGIQSILAHILLRLKQPVIRERYNNCCRIGEINCLSADSHVDQEGPIMAIGVVIWAFAIVALSVPGSQISFCHDFSSCWHGTGTIAINGLTSFVPSGILGCGVYGLSWLAYNRGECGDKFRSFYQSVDKRGYCPPPCSVASSDYLPQVEQQFTQLINQFDITGYPSDIARSIGMKYTLEPECLIKKVTIPSGQLGPLLQFFREGEEAAPSNLSASSSGSNLALMS